MYKIGYISFVKYKMVALAINQKWIKKPVGDGNAQTIKIMLDVFIINEESMV